MMRKAAESDFVAMQLKYPRQGGSQQ